MCTYISLSCLMAVHGGKSLQASGVRNENSYEQPCKPINSGWAFCGKKKYKNLNPISKEEEMNKQTEKHIKYFNQKELSNLGIIKEHILRSSAYENSKILVDIKTLMKCNLNCINIIVINYLQHNYLCQVFFFSYY